MGDGVLVYHWATKVEAQGDPAIHLMLSKTALLEKYGFVFSDGGVHLARSMMLKELTTLFDVIPSPEATTGAYVRAIKQDNCLGKQSGSARNLTARHLLALYSLDPSLAVFRALKFFWQRDDTGRPLLALLCAFARDPILRASAPFISGLPGGEAAPRESMEAFIDQVFPGRFSAATLKSTAQNLLTSWTASGHLSGSRNKIRTKPTVTTATVAYALFLQYLLGTRGSAVLTGKYVALLDTEPANTVNLAEYASRAGWMVFKHIGEVMESSFPILLTETERGWIHEQG